MGGQLPRQHSMMPCRGCYGQLLTVSATVVAMPEYSQSAYRHGDYVAKYGVFPLGEAQKAIEDQHIKDSDPINVISQHIRNFHQNHKVTYSFCAQLLQNLDEQPVDDIGVEWDGEQIDNPLVVS
jgi:hypothetical protein